MKISFELMNRSDQAAQYKIQGSEKICNANQQEQADFSIAFFE